MLRRRKLLRGLQFGNSNINGLQLGRSGSGYDVVDYGYDNYGHDQATYGHESDGGYNSHDPGYGHSGAGGYGHETIYSHSGGGNYGHGNNYGHDIGYHHDSGNGHASYGHGYGASYGSYGKMDCPGIPIALLLITLLGIAVLGFILFTKIQAAGRRKRSDDYFTNIPDLLQDFEDVLSILQFGR